MIISKAKYDSIVKTRDDALNLAETVIKLNGRVIESNGKLIKYIEDCQHNPFTRPESYLDVTMAIVDDMTMAQRRELLKYLEDSIERNKKPITKEEWEEVSLRDLH